MTSGAPTGYDFSTSQKVKIGIYFVMNNTIYRLELYTSRLLAP